MLLHTLKIISITSKDLQTKNVVLEKLSRRIVKVVKVLIDMIIDL